MKKYAFERDGLQYEVQLSDEDAKLYRARGVELDESADVDLVKPVEDAKPSSKPEVVTTKQATPRNKSADADNK